MAEGGEKTEQASPKKREDERKKGNVLMSKDVVTILAVVVSFYAFSFFIGSFVEQIKLNYEVQMHRIVMVDTLDGAEVMKLFREFLTIFITSALPPMLLIGFIAVVATMAQTKMLVSKENLKFKMERLSPLKGIKRMFSLRALVELVKNILKIILITYLLYGHVKDVIGLLPGMMDWEILQGFNFVGEEIMALVGSVTIAFGVVAAADFFYQRYEYEKGIRMTKQEVKDEYKQMEGNPEIKGQRRQKQREFAQKRMMSQVKDADVIVRNPTHFAVALKYQLDTDPAPVVLAKGADLVALKIVEEGEKYGVATVEDKALARGLYSAAEVLDYIPAEFFQPVAELLAWIYSVKEGKASKNGPPQYVPPESGADGAEQAEEETKRGKDR